MPALSRDDAEIYYEVHGSGPAVVLCHGAGGNAASFWQQVPAFAAAGHRVVTLDQRGYGRSRCTPDAFDPARFPADLLGVLDACGIDRAALVCQSMGGWTGLPTAVAHPERVTALVLCGTPGGIRTPEVIAAMAASGTRLASAGGARVASHAALGETFKRARPDLTFLYEQLASFNVHVPADALRKLASVRISPDALGGFHVPTLVIAGDEDVLFPPDALQSVANAIPSARFEPLQKVGHSSYFEVPDQFNALVLEFLAKHR
jgi:pimeloyl-ACP methyl ester carboxylesterase